MLGKVGISVLQNLLSMKYQLNAYFMTEISVVYINIISVFI